MANKKNPNVEYLKNEVERFHWDHYKISPKSGVSNLITLYWYCVTSDIISQHKKAQEGKVNDIELRNESGSRLYYSFLDCFFEAHKLYHGLLGRFEGFSIIKHDQEREEWKKWKDKFRAKTWETFGKLVGVCVKNYHLKEGIFSNMNIQSYDITAFDDTTPKIPQKISTALVSHLKNGTMNAPEPGTMNAQFLFNIKDRVIDQLHSYGLQYVKNRMTCETLNDIDWWFENGEKIIFSQKRLLEHQSIKDAILDLFKRWPKFKDCSDTEVAYLIKQKYKDSDESEFKRDSIKRALKRMDEKERRRHG